MRFPGGLLEGGFPPQERGTALTKLPQTTGLTPSRNSTASTLARSPLTQNSRASDTLQREGGAGKAVEVKAWGCQPEHRPAGMGEWDREATFLVRFYDSSFLFWEAGGRAGGRAAATKQG